MLTSVHVPLKTQVLKEKFFHLRGCFFLFVLLATMGKLLVLLLFITKSISLANIGCVFLQPPNIKMKLEPQTTFRSQLPCRVVVL